MDRNTLRLPAILDTRKGLIDMAYQRKTRDVYVLYVNYGQGYEEEIHEDTRAGIRQRAKEYRENCPQYPVKWSLKRIPVEVK